MSLCSSRRASKAMYSPSGDQRGVPVRGRPSPVNCRSFEPSLSHAQISSIPERLDTKTIRFPSVEICGRYSSEVLERILVCRLVLLGELGNSTRKKLVARWPET